MSFKLLYIDPSLREKEGRVETKENVCIARTHKATPAMTTVALVADYTWLHPTAPIDICVPRT